MSMLLQLIRYPLSSLEFFAIPSLWLPSVHPPSVADYQTVLRPFMRKLIPNSLTHFIFYNQLI